MLRDILERDGNKGRAWLIGIGGIGVSGIAKILHGDGHPVSGSDLDCSPVTEQLIDLGIPVTLGHRAINVPADAAAVIHSAAVKAGHPELEEARRRGLPTLKYAEVLGRLMAERRGIAVSGTHGKTTTTAMISHALVAGGLDPTMVVGGSIPALGGSSRVGRSELMVAEACEYDRSFLNLRPEIAVVTNIEEDHLDYYKDIADIRSAFRAFASLVPARGRIVVCGEDAGAVATVSGLEARAETYGISVGADWLAYDVDLGGGRPRYTLARRGERICRVELLVPGRHNVLDSLAAIAACAAAGMPVEDAARALASFGGVNRRFQLVASAGGVAVIDDYAHHPTEIRSVVRAARQRYPRGNVIAVFQPHQHSRTRHLLGDFAAALAEADLVVLPDIYFSRDSDAERRAISAVHLVAELQRLGADARHIPSFEAIARHVAGIAREGDVVVTMGAGDVYKVAHLLAATRTTIGAAA
jgi:UDP-N-acetylmuramate--alanine ligase